MTDNPTHAELVERLRGASAMFIHGSLEGMLLFEAASFIESQASRIEELEAARRADDTVFVEWLRAWSKKRFGKWITHNTARGALKEFRAALGGKP